MGNSTPVPPYREVVYSFKANGTIEVRVSGPRGFEMLYPILGVAARYAFMYARPIIVMENGLPFRTVSVLKSKS